MDNQPQDWWKIVKDEAIFIARLVGLVTIGVALRRAITYLSGNSDIARTILGGGLDDQINEAAKRDPFFRKNIGGSDDPTNKH